jgi:hypothetical protein
VETPEFPIFACDLMSCPGLPFIGDTWIFNILCADLLLVSCPADLPSLVTPGFLIFVCDPSLGTPVFPIFYVRFTTGELCRSSLVSGKHLDFRYLCAIWSVVQTSPSLDAPVFPIFYVRICYWSVV